MGISVHLAACMRKYCKYSYIRRTRDLGGPLSPSMVGVFANSDWRMRKLSAYISIILASIWGRGALLYSADLRIQHSLVSNQTADQFVRNYASLDLIAQAMSPVPQVPLLAMKMRYGFSKHLPRRIEGSQIKRMNVFRAQP